MFFRKKVNEIDDDYDDDNWDDFDDLDEGGFDSPPDKTGPRQVVTKLVGSFTKGVKDSLLSSATHRKFLKESLPDGYVSHYDDILDTSSTVRDLYDTASKEVKKTHDTYRKELRPHIQEYHKNRGNKFTSVLNKWASKGSDREREGNIKAPSEEQLAFMQASEGIFGQTSALQTAQAKNNIEQSEENSTDLKAGLLQGAEQNNTLTKINNQLNQQSAFNEQVALRWKRKTLELQFKHYFTARKQLETSNQVKDLLTSSLTAIVKNTGLPDAQKINFSEAAKSLFRDKWIGDIHDAAAGGFKTKLEKIGKRAGDRITETLASARDNAGLIDQFAAIINKGGEDDMFGETPAELLLSMVGGAAGSKATDILLGKVSDQVKGKVNDSNFDTEKLDGQIQLTKATLPFLMDHYIENGTGIGAVDNVLKWIGAGDFISSKANTLMHSPDKHRRDQALFDIETKNSITYQIPTLLSEIHGEVNAFRQALAPDSRVDRDSLLRMDWKTGRLNTTGNITTSRMQEMFNSSRREAVEVRGRDFLTKLGHKWFDDKGNLLDGEDGNIILDKDAISALSQELQVASFDKTKIFDLVDIAAKRNSIIKGEEADKLAEFFISQHEIDPNGVSLSTSSDLPADLKRRVEDANSKSALATAKSIEAIKDFRINNEAPSLYKELMERGEADIAARMGLVGLGADGSITFEPGADIKRLFDKEEMSVKPKHLTDLQRDIYSDKYGAQVDARRKIEADRERARKVKEQKEQIDKNVSEVINNRAIKLRDDINDFTDNIKSGVINRFNEFIDNNDTLREKKEDASVYANTQFNKIKSFTVDGIKAKTEKTAAERGWRGVPHRIRSIAVLHGETKEEQKERLAKEAEAKANEPEQQTEPVPEPETPRRPAFREVKRKRQTARIVGRKPPVFKPVEQEIQRPPYFNANLVNRILADVEIQMRKTTDNHYLGGTVRGLFKSIRNFITGGQVQDESDAFVKQLSKGLVSRLSKYKESPTVTKMLAPAIKAEKDAGGDPQIVVADRGEEIISNKDNDAAIFRMVKKEGLWDDIKNTVNRFNSRQIGENETVQKYKTLSQDKLDEIKDKVDDIGDSVSNSKIKERLGSKMAEFDARAKGKITYETSMFNPENQKPNATLDYGDNQQRAFVPLNDDGSPNFNLMDVDIVQSLMAGANIVTDKERGKLNVLKDDFNGKFNKVKDKTTNKVKDVKQSIKDRRAQVSGEGIVITSVDSVDFDWEGWEVTPLDDENFDAGPLRKAIDYRKEGDRYLVDYKYMDRLPPGVAVPESLAKELEERGYVVRNKRDEPKKGLLRRALGATWSAVTFGPKTAWKGMKMTNRALLGTDSATDIYLIGEDTPVITKRDMKKGRYFDKESGEPIHRLSDIKGDVIDANGFVVISAEDIANDKVVSPNGRPIKGLIGINLTALTTLINGGFGLAKLTAGGTFGLAKFSVGTSAKVMLGLFGPTKRKLKRDDDDFIVEDIYVKGENKPSIYAKDVKRGFYVDGEGNPIERYGDLKPPIYDINGVIVLDEEEFEHGLVYPDGSIVGKVIKSGLKLGGTLTSAGFDLASFGVKSSGGILKLLATGGLKLTGAAFKGVGKFFNFLGIGGDDFGGLSGSKYKMMLQTQAAAVDKLEMIRLLLDARMPDKDGKYNDVDEDGHRDGSYYAQLKKKKEEEEKEGFFGKFAGFFSNKKDVKGKEEKGGFFKSALESIGGMITAGPLLAAVGGSLIALFGPQLYKMLKHSLRSMLPKWLGGYSNEEELKSGANNLFGRGQSPKGYEGESLANMGSLPHNPEDLDNPDGTSQPVMPEEVNEPGWFESRPFWQKAAMGYLGLRHSGSIIKGGWGATKWTGKKAGGLIAKAASKSGLTSRLGIAGLTKSQATKQLLRTGGSAIARAGSSTLGRVLASNALRAGATSAVGSLAGTATASAAGATAGAAGAGGIGALLASNPVGWAIAAGLAVAAVGYGGYKLYKYLSTKNDNLLFELRMKQYGFTHKNQQMVEKILEFENYLESKTSPATKQAPAKVSGADEQVAFRIFKINPADPQAMQNFKTWYLYRFKPIYISWKTAIDRQGANVKIGEADEKLLIKDKISVVELSYFNSTSQNPYQIMVPPATGLEPLDIGLEEVNEAYDKTLKSLRNINPEKHDEKVKAAGGGHKSKDAKRRRSKALEKISKPEDAKATDDVNLSGNDNVKGGGKLRDKSGKARSPQEEKSSSGGFFHNLYFGDPNDESSTGIKGFFEKFAKKFSIGGSDDTGSLNTNGFAGQGASGDLTPTAGQSKAERKANFIKIMTLAFQAGETHPAILAAQWALESGWGKKSSGKNNLFGIKATSSQPGTVVWTHEVIGGVRKRMRQKFRDYNSVMESIKDRIDLLKRNPVYARAGYYKAKTPAQAAKALQGTYATDTKYAKRLTDIISGMGIDPNAPSANFKPAGSKPAENKQQPTPQSKPQPKPKDKNEGAAASVVGIIPKLVNKPISKDQKVSVGVPPMLAADNGESYWDANSPANKMKKLIRGEGILPKVNDTKPDGTAKTAIDKANERVQVPRAKMTEQSPPVLAARYARSKAGSRTQGLCARYVRMAIQSGGRYAVPSGNASAYMYATKNTLVNHGFTQIHPGTKWQIGDIMVFNRNGAHPHGHIQIWDGKNWISDFVQKTWKVYRSNCPPFKLYRDSNFLNGAASYKGWTTATSANVGSPDEDNPLPYSIGGGEDTDAMGISKPIVQPWKPPRVSIKKRTYEERMEAVTGYKANELTGRSGKLSGWKKNGTFKEISNKWNQNEKPDKSAIAAINKKGVSIPGGIGTMSPVSWKTDGEKYESKRTGAEAVGTTSMVDDARTRKFELLNIYKSTRKGAESSSDATMADDARSTKFKRTKLYESLRKGAEAAGFTTVNKEITKPGFFGKMLELYKSKRKGAENAGDATVNPEIRKAGYFGKLVELYKSKRKGAEAASDTTIDRSGVIGGKSPKLAGVGNNITQSTGSEILDKVLSKPDSNDTSATLTTSQSDINKMAKGGFVDEFGRLVTKWGEPITGPDGSQLLVDKNGRLDKRLSPLKLANLIKSKGVNPTESAKAWMNRSAVAKSILQDALENPEVQAAKAAKLDGDDLSVLEVKTSKIVDPKNNPDVVSKLDDKSEDAKDNVIKDEKKDDKTLPKDSKVKESLDTPEPLPKVDKVSKADTKKPTDTKAVVTDILAKQQQEQVEQIRNAEFARKVKMETDAQHTSIMCEQLNVQRSMDRRLEEIAKYLKTMGDRQVEQLKNARDLNQGLQQKFSEPVSYGQNQRIRTVNKAEPVSMKIK